MTRDKIEYIASLQYEAEKWRKIGGWGSLIAFAALLIDLWFRHIGAASLLFESAIFGGFVCCWAGNFDRASKHKRELDTICFALFGKSYEGSHLDIIELNKTKLM
ncbi:hypothetical protein GTB75_002319 [Salmonella enterica]|nr:hypothetical protein [Salmonella enterica]EHF0447999.1 hypothetical protein [Salmonella enterica subsp. enterica serovar Javiana]